MADHSPTLTRPEVSASPCRTGDSWCAHARALTGGGLVLLALLATYAPVLVTLVGQWWANDKYSFGFLIPWISLYLVRVRREELSRIARRPSYAAGLCALVASSSMLIVGRVGAMVIVEQLSLIVTIAALVLLLFGTRYLKALALPISYLLLMVPIWEVVTDRLHFPFQVFSATAGATLLQAVGIPAYRDRHYIELPNVVLDVAEGCSGVNYLLAVVAIGIPLASLFLDGWRRRLLLLSLGVTVSLAANALRVALIGVLAYNGHAGASHGPFHVLQGLSVAMVGYAGIFAGLWGLSRGQPRRPATLAIRSVEGSTSPMRHAGGTPLLAVCLSVLLLLATGTFLRSADAAPVPPRMDLEAFPLDLGAWKGRDAPPVYAGYGDLGVDQELSRVYETASGDAAHLYVGYFEYQEQDRELVNHRTDELFGDAATVRIHLDGGRSIEVKRRVQDTPDGEMRLLFWYDLNGRIVADRYLVKLYTIWNALAHGRSNGAVVLVATAPRRPSDPAEGRSPEAAFIAELLPVLSRYLPNA